jgi:hypothetical protein
MKTIIYYEIMRWDGGDLHNASGVCFFSKEEANEFLGDNRYDLIRENTVVVYDSVEEYYAVTSAETKQRALAKLTDVEKRALGLL